MFNKLIKKIIMLIKQYFIQCCDKGTKTFWGSFNRLIGMLNVVIWTQLVLNPHMFKHGLLSNLLLVKRFARAHCARFVAVSFTIARSRPQHVRFTDFVRRSDETGKFREADRSYCVAGNHLRNYANHGSMDSIPSIPKTRDAVPYWLYLKS